jgi:hypothetical protein
MTVDMQSLVTTPPPGEGASIEEGRDSVDSVDCGNPAGLDVTIDQLSETLRHLQKCAPNEHVQAVCGLLAKAQGELIKVSARDGSVPLGGQTETFVTEPLRTEEDLSEIKSIPTADLLNRCFEVHAKKHVKESGERYSSVSTASSLGGSNLFSARTSLESSPRDTLPSPVLSSSNLSTRSIAPTRPSLPCFETRRTLPENRIRRMGDATPAYQPNRSLRLVKLEVRQEPISSANQAVSMGEKDNIECSKLRELSKVEAIDDEEADDWELEFLRRLEASEASV